MSTQFWSRREVLKVVSASALVVAHARPAAAQAVKWSAGTATPKLKAPANATDCHHHIYNAKYPVDLKATLRPGDALVDDYRAFQKRIGTTRNVLVQPSTYGTDNRCHLDALAAFGPTARMVAVVNDSVSTEELKRMHALGVRGIRFNLAQVGATTPEMIEPLSKRINDLGWHIQINAPATKIMEIMPILERVPSPIVFDHLAHIPQPDGVNHPLYTKVRALMDKGRTWVPRWGRRPMRTPARSRARTRRQRPSDACGAATGRIPASSGKSCRTTPCSSTCSPTGCPMRKRATASWLRIQRASTIFRRAREVSDE